MVRSGLARDAIGGRPAGPRVRNQEVQGMTEMVRLDRLAKRFGPVHAVEEVSFSVERGEVLGFLGPNGAGKSTTMRMVTGFIAPSAGSATVMGHDVVKEPIEAKKRIGYLPEGAPLYGDMTVAAFLRFVAEMRGLHGQDGRRRMDTAIARTQLEEVAHRPIETLSKGFKRRVGIAQAIMHDPPVLVLDEPTDGLDPNQKHGVRALIDEMAEDKAIIISTHILEEVDAICTRAVIIAGGRIVADARPEELKRRSRYHNAVRLTVNANLPPKLQPLLESLPNVAAVERAGAVNGVATLLVVPRPNMDVSRDVSDLIRRSGVAFDELVIEQGRLDDVFRELTMHGS
jgi:ABC-2 type transport system ATP-binding protein